MKLPTMCWHYLNTITISEISFYPSWDWIVFYFYSIVFMFSVYTILFLLATISILKRYREIPAEDLYGLLRSESLPPITFLVPAFNESKNIIYTINTLLNLSYRYKQIIIINDGSTDNTLELLKHYFSLVKVPPSYPGKIPTQRIRDYYQSENFPDLHVIDKENGGKADALNAGLNSCTTPAFISSDADSLIDDRVLSCLIRPFLEKQDTVIVHSSVCLANGCTIANNRIIKYGFPQKMVTGYQVIEYLRGFYLDRMGFNWSQGSLIVPGAFGIFKTDIVQEIGGYHPDSIAEDMEIIMRIHAYLLNEKRRYRINFIPDPVVWTEAPETWSVLRKQRRRWYTGTTQCMWEYRRMFFNPRYRSIGMIVYPYYVIDKLVLPLVEVSGYLIVLIGIYLGKFNLQNFFFWGCGCWAFTTCLSMLCILVEETTFRKYTTFTGTMQMLYCTLLENLIYHYLTLGWKLRGLLIPKDMKKLWQITPRAGFEKIGQ